jgi:hypothetical protein
MGMTKSQKEASRRNGKKSRGPVTKAGKKASSANSVKHGVLALVHPAPGEPPDVYREAEKALGEVLHPENVLEGDLVRSIAVDIVRSQRVGDYIEAAQNLYLDEVEDQDGDLREELQRLRTLKAQWLNWIPKVENIETLDKARRVDVLEAIIGLMESAGVDDSPELINSTFYVLDNVKGLVEGARRHTVSLFHWKEKLLGAFHREIGKVDEAIQGLQHRIDYRREQRRVMAKAIPDDKTIGKVSRYQRLIDSSLTRHIRLLNELRQLSGEGSSTEAEKKTSRLFSQD